MNKNILGNQALNESPASPSLSAILITSSDYSSLRESIAHLKLQSALSSLEIVIVCPSKEKLKLDLEDVKLFSFLEIIELENYISSGDVLATGFKNANSPIVAYIEEHSYPDPQWAEAILEAHKGNWAVVGWSIENANPETLISWASLFADFGPWVELKISQEMEILAPHHCSYKKDLILSFGEELGTLSEIETILHSKLKQSGHRLYFESATQSKHVNFSKFAHWVTPR